MYPGEAEAMEEQLSEEHRAEALYTHARNMAAIEEARRIFGEDEPR